MPVYTVYSDNEPVWSGTALRMAQITACGLPLGKAIRVEEMQPSGRTTDITDQILGRRSRYFTAVGAFLVYHSTYKGMMIYRQVNALSETPMMSYYGIVWDCRGMPTPDTKYRTCVHAKNLSGIKDAISKVKA